MVRDTTLSWKDVPGYRPILKSILLELKEREDADMYPEALKDATCALLWNEKLINVFITIIFKKTYIYDTYAVNGALELIDRWFTSLHRNRSLLPAQFDYLFFFKAVHMLMEMDHGMSTAKCIWMLFRILHVIPLQQRSQLIDQLL